LVIPLGRAIDEIAAIKIVRDLLQTLTFVHKNNVIHRDIKPSNIIRRHSDGKLVLIDFGAVKEVSTKQLDTQEQTPFTIGIGTQGYAPSEQCFGRPHYSSDIYAVGMVGIKALTGIAPRELERDANGEIKWGDAYGSKLRSQVSISLAKILSKMVLDDFKQRYQSALEALEDLKAFEDVVNSQSRYPILEDDSLINTLDQLNAPTKSCSEASSETF
jgi:serine/threonine protein kinase